jgi:formylglycine-generating enzyme required for sulfatase activity
MRWFCLSLLIGILGLAAVIPASRPSVAQNKQLTNFELGLLAEHNNVRQRNNVKPLVWDDALATTAQEWANKIAADGVQPPAHRAGSPYGENIISGRIGTLDPKSVLAKWESNQVISSTTTKVGCGKARSKDGQTDFLVCNYNSPGNQLGQSPFATSPTSTQTATLTPAGTPTPATASTTTSVSTANTNVECDPETTAECEKQVRQLVAEVEQLRKQIGESAKLTTPPATTTPNTNTSCEDLRQRVQQLTAEVEQLKKNPEAAKLATPTPTPPPPPLDPNQKCPKNKYGIELLPIPGKSFCMGKYEVTQAQWKAVRSYNPSRFKGDSLPVERVSWEEAQDFINKLNADNDGFTYRLPNEEEWEYACRAGTTGRFYGDLDDIAWYKEDEEDDEDGKTHAVGGKEPNAFGLYDMTGNVWEWCEDWYDEDDKDKRVLRGGSWHSYPSRRLRSSFRSGIRPDDREDYVGFRVLAERPPTIIAVSTPSPTLRPVARKIDTFGATAAPPAAPVSTINISATCEDLRKTEQELIAQLEELKKPKPRDPNAKCPANKYGIEFVPIPGQTICLGKYEVTQAQWKSLMGRNPSDFEGDSFPVENVDWKDAQEFTDKLNAGNDGFKYRLPTDAEWEYACRAGTTGLYYGDVNDIGWHKRNSENHPHAVGGKQPNAFGLYDMSGNVSEWVQDWYNEKDWERGLRGGSWYDLTQKLRSGNKSGWFYYARRNYIGFRVAVERVP